MKTRYFPYVLTIVAFDRLLEQFAKLFRAETGADFGTSVSALAI
jgi:hypothetical protein